MRSSSVVGVVLCVLGAVVLLYSGITFTTPGETVSFLGLHLATRVSHFIPPVAGAIALGFGVVLLLVGRSPRAA